MTTQLTTTDPAAEPERPPRGRLKRLVLGRPSDPAGRGRRCGPC